MTVSIVQGKNVTITNLMYICNKLVVFCWWQSVVFLQKVVDTERSFLASPTKCSKWWGAHCCWVFDVQQVNNNLQISRPVLQATCEAVVSLQGNCQILWAKRPQGFLSSADSIFSQSLEKVVRGKILLGAQEWMNLAWGFYWICELRDKKIARNAYIASKQRLFGLTYIRSGLSRCYSANISIPSGS